jgi:GH18 family chitinase
VWREGEGKYNYNDIDVSLFTHLIYCNFGLSPDGDIIFVNEDLDIGREFIKHFIELKSKNPDCKMLASLAGGDFISQRFSEIASTPEGRSALARNSLDFLNQYDFDGE